MLPNPLDTKPELYCTVHNDSLSAPYVNKYRNPGCDQGVAVRRNPAQQTRPLPLWFRIGRHGGDETQERPDRRPSTCGTPAGGAIIFSTQESANHWQTCRGTARCAAPLPGIGGAFRRCQRTSAPAGRHDFGSSHGRCPTWASPAQAIVFYNITQVYKPAHLLG